MRRCESRDLTWLEFELFSECKKLVHGVFLRHGGVSRAPFDSLNCSFSSGDLFQNVCTNHKRIAHVLSIPILASSFQVHGDTIAQANPYAHPFADGLTTDSAHLGLVIKHADCQSAIFYDPKSHALANIHCGWRGNVLNIYAKTIEAMKNRYGSKPENLLVGISPSLGPNAAEFIHYKQELPKIFYPFQHKSTYFDLWEIASWQLREAGVLPGHIEIARICTYANTQDYFSYRREAHSGRHATVAALL